MTTLKPCPFCGAAAYLETDNDHHGGFFNLGCINHWGAIEEDACPAGRLWYTEPMENIDKAIKLWNQRVEEECTNKS